MWYCYFCNNVIYITVTIRLKDNNIVFRAMETEISNKVIERLSVYRRNLQELLGESQTHIYSHQLAERAGVSAARLRRDLMVTGSAGSPARGYDVERLLKIISEFLDGPDNQNIAIIGTGNLGRAILGHIRGRCHHLKVVAGFDIDEHRVNRVIMGCRCYLISELETIVREKKITVAVITVPADAAQQVADMLVAVGIKSIVNFAPVVLKVPANVFVEYIDISVALTKAAYFAREH